MERDILHITHQHGHSNRVRTVEYDPSPRVSPNTKSWADKRVFADGFRDLDGLRDLERG